MAKFAEKRSTPEPNDKFVVLKGIKHHNSFFSLYEPTTQLDDVVRLSNGDVVYEIISFAATIAEAQTILYGRTFK